MMIELAGGAARFKGCLPCGGCRARDTSALIGPELLGEGDIVVSAIAVFDDLCHPPPFGKQKTIDITGEDVR